MCNRWWIYPKSKVSEMVAVFIATLKQMMFTILTMLFILATARVMQYSGMIAAVAALFSVFGPVYPFFAPMLGALGTFRYRIRYKFKCFIWISSNVYCCKYWC